MRNPARSRPLSKNVKRLMAMAREQAYDAEMYTVQRSLTGREAEFCRLQGEIFREAVKKGHDMESFSELFMNSQMATTFDYSFFRPVEGTSIPLMMGAPGEVVDTLYEIERIVKDAHDSTNLVKAVMKVEEERGWGRLSSSGKAPVDYTEEEAAYAFWLGYIYRCECLIHEESSRMVYGAFPEKMMREVYREHEEIPNMLVALEICCSLDSKFIKENIAKGV